MLRARSEVAPRLDGLADSLDQITPEHITAVVAVPAAGLSRRLRRTASSVRPAPASRRWVWAVGLVAAGAAGAYAFRTVRRRRAADAWGADAAFGPVPSRGVDEAKSYAAQVNDVRAHETADDSKAGVIDMRAKAAETLAKASAKVADAGSKIGDKAESAVSEAKD